MKIQQLSIFAENKPGHIAAPAACWRKTASTSEPCRWPTPSNSESCASSCPTRKRRPKSWRRRATWSSHGSPGRGSGRPSRGLSKILTAFDQTTINIEYMYAFPFGQGERAVLIFRFNDPDGAAAALKAAGFNLVSKSELFGR